MSDRYVTVRDINGSGSKDGTFFVNVLNNDGDFNSSSNHAYNQKRSARRAARKLATKLGVPYRQDLEYGNGRRGHAIPEPVATV